MAENPEPTEGTTHRPHVAVLRQGRAVAADARDPLPSGIPRRMSTAGSCWTARLGGGRRRGHRPSGPALRPPVTVLGSAWSADSGVGAAYVVGLAIVDARQILLLIFLALFIAVGLEPLVAFLFRHGVKRGWAVLIVTLIVLGAVTGLLAAAIPPLVNETTDLVRLAPHYLQELNNRARSWGSLEQALPPGHPSQELALPRGPEHGRLGVVGAGEVVVGLLGIVPNRPGADDLLPAPTCHGSPAPCTGSSPGVAAPGPGC